MLGRERLTKKSCFNSSLFLISFVVSLTKGRVAVAGAVSAAAHLPGALRHVDLRVAAVAAGALRAVPVRGRVVREAVADAGLDGYRQSNTQTQNVRQSISRSVSMHKLYHRA